MAAASLNNYQASAMFTLSLALRSLMSKFLFDQVYETSQEVIDELYHLDQGLEYCMGNFSHWNPKITTPPGLYLMSTILTSTFFDCNIYNLRLVNFIASAVNVYLLRRILDYYQGGNNLKTILQSVSLSMLPPYYFFSFLYYTDVLSVTFFLLIMDLSIRNSGPFNIIMASFMAILMRQTNVVWIGMFLGVRLMEIFLKSPSFKKLKHTKRAIKERGRFMPPKLNGPRTDHPKAITPMVAYGLDDFYKSFKYHLSTRLRFFSECLLYNFADIFPYVFVIFAFIAFLLINGSITVGDKDAHAAMVHLPQIFYFSLFYGIFCLPHVLLTIKDTMACLFNNKLPTLICAIIMAVIVNQNTIVHPYLLADNRHYTFYVWNRWFGKYPFARYVTIPVYIVLITSLAVNIRKTCISYWLPFLPCAFAAMALQRMIEVRYFIIPFFVLRLRFESPSWMIILMEMIVNELIIIATFYIFFTKEIHWNDMDGIQRLMW